jgi:LytS/YehU family sensor histidine kinase
MAIVGKICEYIVEELLRDILSVFSNEIDFIKEDENIDGWRYSTWIVSAFLISNVVAFRHKMQEDLRQHEILSAEKKALEMKTLKSQINSHFLHNALNNIYSMIYFGNREDAAKYVLKLSQMLRYVLDDCEAERIPMSKEVTYIKNYIDFQKARFDTNKDIRFNYIQHDSGLTYTPPMIFQPLIENCFKYCPLEKADAFVHIELETDGNRIRFTGENTKNKTEMPDRNNNGIGIKNLDKRLRISYGDNYSLNIFDGADVFRVELTITI